MAARGVPAPAVANNVTEVYAVVAAIAVAAVPATAGAAVSGAAVTADAVTAAASTNAAAVACDTAVSISHFLFH